MPRVAMAVAGAKVTQVALEAAAIMMMLRTISKAWRRDTFTPPAGSARCSNTSLSLALRRRNSA